MTTDIYIYCTNLIRSITSMSWLKASCSGILAVIVYLLGESTKSFTILFVLILIDLIMALIVIAYKDIRFESVKLRHTAIKVLVYFFAVAAGIQFDKILNITKTGFLPDEPIAKMILVVLAATEVLSVLEHASQLGFVIPVKIFRNIKKVRSGIE